MAFVGALQELEGIVSFDTFVGTSAGAIVALLLAAGYSPKELESELQTTNFGEFLDAGTSMAILSLLTRGYLYPGDRIVSWLRELLKQKYPNRTKFSDLKHRAILLATSPAETKVFDYPGSSSDPALAARISMSIPYVFAPRVHDNERVYDGGVTKNSPIIAARDRVPNRRVLGLYLGAPSKPRGARRGPFKQLRDLVSIWLLQDKPELVDRFREQVIVIDTKPVSTLDFGLTTDEKDLLTKRGRLAVARFLTNNHLGLRNSRTRQELVELERDVSDVHARVEKERRRRRWRKIAGVVAVLVTAIGVLLVWLLFR